MTAAEPGNFADLAERLRRRQDGTSIGERTAAELNFGPPPDQVAHPFLTPDGSTFIYGKGGVGKGLITCWLIAQLVRLGHVVMIVDYEGHEREWGSRLRGMGLTHDELRRIEYRAPFSADWLAPAGALKDVADLVREDAKRLSVTYLIVDSYTFATSTGDQLGGMAGAQEYFSALTRIGLPSLTLAHVTGDSGRFPARPFGSVFVHNGARETWSVEQIGERSDDDSVSRVVKVELRNQKRSNGAEFPAQFMTFEFFADGSIVVDTTAPAGRSVADQVADVLHGNPMTVKQIAAAVVEDTGNKFTEDTISKTLRRYPGRFEVDGDKRPKKWTSAA